MPPPSVYLNPSDADFAAYEEAALALTWRNSDDADPTAWQHKAREKLRELMGMVAPASDFAPIVGGVSTIAGGLSRQTFYLQTARRRHAAVTIVWNPRTAHSLPVMLCLQGHTSGAHISWGQAILPEDYKRIESGGDFAIQAVRHGHVAICIEQIAFGERREQALAHRWEHTCIDASNRALLLGRTLLGDRVTDVLTVIDWLQKLPPEVPVMNARRIRAMGNSAGGETALYVAAMDPRVEGVIASGCVGAWRQTSGVRMTCPDTVVPDVLNWIEYSDVLALCAPRPLLVVSGVRDHIYPFHLASACAETARPAYSAFRASNRLRAISGEGGHRFYPDVAWPAFLKLLETSAS